MYKTRLNAAYFVVNGLQAWEQLLHAEVAQGVNALGLAIEGRQMQGHGRSGLVVMADGRQTIQIGTRLVR